MLYIWFYAVWKDTLNRFLIALKMRKVMIRMVKRYINVAIKG